MSDGPSTRLEYGSWIWHRDGVTYGVALDGERLTWTDAVGSLCGDDDGFAEQTRAAYCRDGPPGAVGPVPSEVSAALAAALPCKAQAALDPDG